MKLPFTTYDVFTNRRFGGNPLAIVEEADGLSTQQMQTIAREFNLSETIFVLQPKDAVNTASVRIFFPTAEIPFAGHPTVGCAIHLAQKKYKPGCSFETEIRLEEVAGLVPVKVSRIGDVPRAQFTAPVVPFAVDVAAPLPRRLQKLLASHPKTSASTVTAPVCSRGACLPLRAAGEPRCAGARQGDRAPLVRALRHARHPAWPTCMCGRGGGRSTLPRPGLCAARRHPRGPCDRLRHRHSGSTAARCREARRRHAPLAARAGL